MHALRSRGVRGPIGITGWWFCLVTVVLFATGGRRLLPESRPTPLPDAAGSPTRTIRFQQTYRVDRNGRLTSTEYRVVQVGESRFDADLTAFDGTIERLTGFEARITHVDGSVDRYDRGQLGALALVGREQITANRLRTVRLRRTPTSGAIIETASEHESTLPELGICFDFSTAGEDSADVSCVIEIPSNETLRYVVLNRDLIPRETTLEGTTTYRFDWKTEPLRRPPSPFTWPHQAPIVLAVPPGAGPASWEQFGDWYLAQVADKLRPDAPMKEMATLLAPSGASPPERMMAVARYCQSSVRYEQVYLEHGEVIPNPAPEVFRRKYGDCKDYAVLMTTLARLLGLEAHLALSRRDAGLPFSDQLPVSQFDHMLVYFRDGGREYWFDGTNPPEALGLPADDLIGAPALVLMSGCSRILTIPESSDNLLSINGSLHTRGADLLGPMTIRLSGQYAVRFYALRHLLNDGDLHAAVSRWLRAAVAGSLVLSSLHVHTEDGAFVLGAEVALPNAIWQVGGGTYFAPDQVFNRLVPLCSPEDLDGPIARSSGYHRVDLRVRLPEFRSDAPGEDWEWRLRYDLPPGPFDAASGDSFRVAARRARAELNRRVKLAPKE